MLSGGQGQLLLVVHYETDQDVAGADYEILFAVQFVGHGGVAEGGAYIGVPEQAAGGGVEGYQIVGRVTGEQQISGCA